MSTPSFPQMLSRFASPWGDLWLSACDAGLSGLWFTDQKHLPDFSDQRMWQRAEHRHMREAMRQLERYALGKPAPQDFELGQTLPLHFNGGTPFQRSVWAALLHIPLGSSTSYGALASSLGQPQASRAVGAAVGRNPIGILVPCHRVLGARGALTGYAGGLERKVALLRLEGLIL